MHPKYINELRNIIILNAFNRIGDLIHVIIEGAQMQAIF